ncbi:MULTISPECIES: ImmA/IrrE family metallo-endopeptidase [unclassified Caballeronia]|uniref:ImmA/IrrE family metallo-endopeptidase n=1 Tax=unclassified Caballeronia TaxID=2646786 RepID=UPI001FD4E4B4|nr:MULTISPECIES: ImmA/IrrE family metallo-endopeptidase [unclassified Caballeronia]
MPIRTAEYLYSKYWDGRLPVDPEAIARAAGVTVNFDPDMGEVFGRFERVDGKPHIYINSREGKRRQRFSIAHELGHFALRHGNSFVDTAKQFVEVPRRLVELQANTFALELLIPGFAVDILIEKRNITSIKKLSEQFHVGQGAMTIKLGQMGWVS